MPTIRHDGTFQTSEFGPLANPKFIMGLIIGLFVLGVVARLVPALGWLNALVNAVEP